MEKYHAMEHEYPSKVDVLAKFGYDPKQLHHLLRVEEYLGRYIDGEPYEDCLHPHRLEYLIDVKRGYYDLEMARIIANTAMDNIIRAKFVHRNLRCSFCNYHWNFSCISS